MQNYMPNGKIPYNNTAQPVTPNAQNPFQPQYQTPPSANPNYAGVNIQIINPMVNPNGGSIYPQQTNSAYNAGTQGGCYPSTYYTTQPGTGYIPGVPAGAYPQTTAGNPTGFYDSNGKFHPYVKDKNGQLGYYDENGQFKPVNSNIQTGENSTEGSNATDGTTSPENPENKNGFYDKDGKFHEYAKGPNGETGYYDENGQFHPVDPNNPNGTNTPEGKDTQKPEDTTAETKPTEGNKETKSPEEQTKTEENKNTEASENGKTEKKKVVELSNDYIKTLENYLNSQDVEIRKMGAHEVVDRLAEDTSRNDDPALTALVNKMLQDPSSAIKTIALSLVESRAILGDDYTVKLLKKMQNSKDGFGLDANQATSALLKMAGQTVEKEVPVTEAKKDTKPEKEEK